VARRRIAVVTSSRADHGHLTWLFHELLARPEVDLHVYATGAHLSPAYGHTVDEIEQAGVPVTERVECLLSSDTDVGMARTIGVATLGFTDVLDRHRPDLLLVVADRYEMLAPASAALALRVPVVHVEGGEASEGAIDHAVRNALTAMAHVHLTPTRLATLRVLAMGEEAWRVHQVGAASLDHLRRSSLLSGPEIRAELGLPADRAPVVVGVHPVTLDTEPLADARATFAALASVPGPIVVCFPNADAGSHAIVSMARELVAGRDDAHLVTNLSAVRYWSLLREARLMVGNSSSGIMESPSVGVPAINVGSRQSGRERAANLIDVPDDAEAIAAAIARADTPEFREVARGAENPYGDGTAAERMAAVLTTLDLDRDRLLHKRASLPPGFDPSGTGD